jgi:hypothetical protein
VKDGAGYLFPAPFVFWNPLRYNRQNLFMETSMESPAKKNQTPLIIAAVAIVLCCCVVVLAVASVIGYNRIRNAQGIAPQPVEDVATITPTDALSIPGEAPTGGLGNDILRNDTWQAVSGAAQALGCDQPLGAHTGIEVLQQPDNGVWKEKWTVPCASGEIYAFEITFTLDATGATYDIKSLP